MSVNVWSSDPINEDRSVVCPTAVSDLVRLSTFVILSKEMSVSSLRSSVSLSLRTWSAMSMAFSAISIATPSVKLVASSHPGMPFSSVVNTCSGVVFAKSSGRMLPSTTSELPTELSRSSLELTESAPNLLSPIELSCISTPLIPPSTICSLLMLLGATSKL